MDQVSNTSPSTSSNLLERVKGRDQEAWLRLSDLYGPQVYHWCRRSGLSSEDAADVAQEVFRSVASGIDQFRRDRAGDTFRGWLWTITRNKVRDHARLGRHAPEAEGGTSAYKRLLSLPEQQRSGSDVDSSCPDTATPFLRRVLDMLCGEFSDQTWRAFWLGTFSGRSAAEIGGELGMTANAVRLAKGRVLRRLRQELGDPSPDGLS